MIEYKKSILIYKQYTQKIKFLLKYNLEANYKKKKK